MQTRWPEAQDEAKADTSEMGSKHEKSYFLSNVALADQKQFATKTFSCHIFPSEQETV